MHGSSLPAEPLEYYYYIPSSGSIRPGRQLSYSPKRLNPSQTGPPCDETWGRQNHGRGARTTAWLGSPDCVALVSIPLAGCCAALRAGLRARAARPCHHAPARCPLSWGKKIETCPQDTARTIYRGFRTRVRVRTVLVPCCAASSPFKRHCMFPVSQNIMLS
jgi:hypothetical protein